MRRQVGQLPGQDVVVRHPLVHVANDPGLVNKIGDPASAVQLANGAVIGDQREVKVELGGEFLVTLQRVFTDAQYLGVELCKTREVVLESPQLGGSAGREVGGVEGQDDRPLLQSTTKLDVTCR